MVYIWYSPEKQAYHLGDLKTFKMVKNKLHSNEELQLLYKFTEQKRWLANKILSQLNSSNP